MRTLGVALALTGWVVISLACFGQAPEVGDRVWAQWTPNDWYPGELIEETALGFLVAFDDTSGVDDVDPDLPATADRPLALIVVDRMVEVDQEAVGTRVLAQGADGWFYPATIVAKAELGLYDVLFDDRDTATVDLAQIHLRGESMQPGPGPAPEVGDIVWAQWEPGDWYPGMVAEETVIGFRVAFDDGDEADLPPSLVIVDRAAEVDQVAFGTRVLAQAADERFYPGTVVNVNEAGLYDILFDEEYLATVDLEDLRLFSE